MSSGPGKYQRKRIERCKTMYYQKKDFHSAVNKLVSLFDNDEITPEELNDIIFFAEWISYKGLKP